MSMRNAMATGLSLSLALSACGGAPDEEPSGAETRETAGTQSSDAATAPQASSGDSDERPAVIAQCIACHSFEKDGPTKIGPNLWGVFGQPAASKSGYTYSNALRGAGLIWDESTLDAYLENPRTTVPGGKMSYAGLRDADKRAETIDYLKTLADTE